MIIRLFQIILPLFCHTLFVRQLWSSRLENLRQGRLPIKTIGEACRQQAQALIETLILYASKQIEHGQKAKELFAFLFAKPQALATA